MASILEHSITGNAHYATNKEPQLIQIPGSSFIQGGWEKTAMWITIQAKQLTGMHTGGRGGNLQIGKKGTTFKFLAPDTILETHNHDWQEYASIQSRLLSKIIAFSTAAEQFGDVWNNIKTEWKDAKKLPSGRRMIDILQTLGDVNVPKYKIDTPLAYSNSQRRQYQLMFVLADGYDGIEMVDAVKRLMIYAAPESVGEISLEYPYVFSVRTEPFELFNLQYAALTSIQPTWQTPYRNGIPLRCELTLSFTDMSPLFKKTIVEGSIVNVNQQRKLSETEFNAGYDQGIRGVWKTGYNKNR